MTVYSPLTAYPKLKTTITKSVEVGGTPFYPHLRGLASLWTVAAAFRDNARLQYRLPADWAVSLVQYTPLKLRVNRCTKPPSLFHENNADAEISTPLNTLISPISLLYNMKQTPLPFPIRVRDTKISCTGAPIRLPLPTSAPDFLFSFYSGTTTSW
jgi:hypothetical protein